MQLVLEEVVNHRHEGREEGGCQSLPVSYSLRVRRAERDAPEHPRQCDDEVRDHEYVVPLVVLARGDVGPSAAGQGPEEAHDSDELGEGAIRLSREEIPEPDESEAGSWTAKCQRATDLQKAARARGYCFLPDVIAMSTWNTDRSGYWSPIAADTEGNHSSG